MVTFPQKRKQEKVTRCGDICVSCDNWHHLFVSLSPFASAEKPIMRMLDARVGDREAQEFVRRLKEIEKSMEEE